MGKPSPARANWPVFADVPLIKRGKAWDSYALGNGLRWLVATDCVSIFEISLNHIFPLKGASLVAYSVAAHLLLSKYGIQTHIVEWGAGIDEFIPERYRNNPDLQSRSLVVHELEMISDYELIVRRVITGHGLEEYELTGKTGQPSICGQPLDPGLQDGDMLPYNVFTPTSKVDVGHDTNVPADPVRQKYPDGVFRVLQAFDIMFNFARSRGVIIADFKAECDVDGVMADELFTIDAMRASLWSVWEASRRVELKPGEKRKMSPGFDKQYIRNWGISMGIKDLNPDDPADIAKVWGWQVPGEVVKHFIQGSKYLFWLLYGKTIDQFRSEDMGIQLPKPEPKRVALVLGSESDKAEIMPLVEKAGPQYIQIVASITSCHRNPTPTMAFAQTGFGGADVAIAAGGKAFQLAGVMDAFAYEAGHSVPVVGVALGKPGSKALLAAQLSIDEIPGQPVIMNEITGQVYTGQEGFLDAISRIVNGELPPPKPRTAKPPQFDFWSNLPDLSEQ